MVHKKGGGAGFAFGSDLPPDSILAAKLAEIERAVNAVMGFPQLVGRAKLVFEQQEGFMHERR